MPNGPRQDHRGGTRPHRAAAPAPHPARARPHPGVATPAVARGALGQVLAPFRGGGPAGDRAPAPPARHGREPLALVQPHRRLLPLPAPARRAGAVPLRLPHPGGLPASALGPADRRRMPPPDAVALRRGQRPVPDAAPGGAAVRAPAVPLRHPAQRPHPLLHRPAGDARPGALHPHERDEPRHARARRGRGDPPAETRRRRGEPRPTLLHPPPAAGPGPRPRSARSHALRRVRRLPGRGAHARI